MRINTTRGTPVIVVEGFLNLQTNEKSELVRLEWIGFFRFSINVYLSSLLSAAWDRPISHQSHLITNEPATIINLVSAPFTRHERPDCQVQSCIRIYEPAKDDEKCKLVPKTVQIITNILTRKKIKQSCLNKSKSVCFQYGNSFIIYFPKLWIYWFTVNSTRFLFIESKKNGVDCHENLWNQQAFPRLLLFRSCLIIFAKKIFFWKYVNW